MDRTGGVKRTRLFLRQAAFVILSITILQIAPDWVKAQSSKSANLLQLEEDAFKQIRRVLAMEIELEGEDAKVFWRLFDEYVAAYKPTRHSLIEKLVTYADEYPNTSARQVTDFTAALMENEQARIGTISHRVAQAARHPDCAHHPYSGAWRNCPKGSGLFF